MTPFNVLNYPAWRPFTWPGVTAGALSAYALLSLEPDLVLDFASEYYRTSGAATTLASATTFTRASGATYTDSAGLLQTATSGTARVGNHVYNGTAWVNEGLLLESEARTNLVTYSNDFTDASWTKELCTVTTFAGSSPVGTGAAKTTTGTGTGTPAIYSDISVTGGSTYSWSFFAKAGTTDWVALGTYDGALDVRQYYDLTNGILGSPQTGTFLSAGIEDYGDGWYLCWATRAVDGAATTARHQINQATADLTLASADTLTLHATAAQFELGPTPSSYIPTTSASATRAAETLIVAAADMPTYTTAVSIQMDGRMTYADTGLGEAVPVRWRIDGSNKVLWEVNTNGAKTGKLDISQSSVGVDDFVSSIDTYYTPGINVPFNIASRHGSTFVNGSTDGVALTANTTPTALPDLSATDFQIGFDFMGNIGKARVWADDIGDTGIARAST